VPEEVHSNLSDAQPRDSFDLFAAQTHIILARTPREVMREENAGLDGVTSLDLPRERRIERENFWGGVVAGPEEKR
jgi:hypothetical protein